jgi:aminopeptidase N
MSHGFRNHERCACGSSLSQFGAASPKPFVLAGTRRVYERARPFGIQHIALDLTLDFDAKSIAAVAELEVTRVDGAATELSLDAVGFVIDHVAVAALPEGRRAAKAPTFRKTDFVYDGETLLVPIAPGVSAATVRVTYSATPRRGLYFIAPDEHVPTRPRQVWSQFQDEDARFVFPCHDKPHVKQTTEVRVKAPPGYYVLSNGQLTSSQKDQKAGIFHWKMSEPHPSYLVTIVAGELALLSDEVDGVPLTYLVPKGREEDGRRTFARTAEMVRHFGRLTGVPFPWNKYAQVVVSDFIFGGMENTTATTMYEHILLDERAAIDITSDDLIAHELAHQWFGDLVTCRDWSHAWLNEGFATFMEHVDREHRLGRDEYEYGVQGDVDAYVGEAQGRYRRPVVCQDYEAPIDIFDRHLYEKGACVLHLLRRELGDATFWRGVNLYLTRHQKSVVDTRDLMRALEEVSGRGLERFFEQWLLRPGHAELDVKLEHEPGALVITVKQTQDRSPGTGPHAGEPTVPLFALTLAFDVAVGSEVRREVRHVSEASHTFVIRTAERPKYVVVDPELLVLGTVKLDAPADMLRAQLVYAKTSRGRVLAARALSHVDDLPTTKALAASLANEEESWEVRAEVASALGELRTMAAFDALAASVTVSHSKIRRAVVSALGHFKTAKSAEILKKLALSDASYLVEAEAARALGATRQPSAFDTLVDILDRPSWADVIRAGAIDGLASLRDERAIPHVLARTRYGVSMRGRRAAVVALPKLASDRRAREVLEELLETSDPYLRVDVIRALVELGDAKSRAALARQLDRDLDGRVRRRLREALRDLGGVGRKDTERLREELEAVRTEHHELKLRLAKLEELAKPAPDSAKKADETSAPSPRG